MTEEEVRIIATTATLAQMNEEVQRTRRADLTRANVEAFFQDPQWSWVEHKYEEWKAILERMHGSGEFGEYAEGDLILAANCVRLPMPLGEVASAVDPRLAAAAVTYTADGALSRHAWADVVAERVGYQRSDWVLEQESLPSNITDKPNSKRQDPELFDLGRELHAATLYRAELWSKGVDWVLREDEVVPEHLKEHLLEYPGFPIYARAPTIQSDHEDYFKMRTTGKHPAMHMKELYSRGARCSMSKWLWRDLDELLERKAQEVADYKELISCYIRHKEAQAALKEQEEKCLQGGM